MLCWSVSVFAALVCAASCAKILVVTPTISKSHYVVFESLIDGLLNRGHEITVITTFPNGHSVPNFTEISVQSVRKAIFNDFNFAEFEIVPERFLDVAPKFFTYINETEKVLHVQDVSDLIKSNSNFDLVIYEMFADDLFIAFAHRFDAPVIALGTCYMFPYVPDRFGIPANPSHFPGFYSGYSDKMDFFQRLRNTFLDVGGRILYYLLEQKITDIAKKHFGSDTPPVRELIKNTSLYFINTHFSLFGAQAYPPKVVDVSGIHLKPPKPLAQELDRWMNESSHGVIYFSFGSMLRGATLPAPKVRTFVEVFRRLPQRVLWKWEDDILDNIPSNVKIMKWLPQRDVIAHPAVKVFISHGGLLGSTEAVVSGVPILGIPMYGDQANNVAALVDKKVAVHIDYNNITTASLYWALNTLLTDSSYSDNAKSLSRRFLDRPLSPLDTAVFWTEYVIRHRGAPHLRSAAVDLTWYQYYLLDIAAFSLTALTVTLVALYYAARSIFKLLGLISSKKVKTV